MSSRKRFVRTTLQTWTTSAKRLQQSERVKTVNECIGFPLALSHGPGTLEHMFALDDLDLDDVRSNDAEWSDADAEWFAQATPTSAVDERDHLHETWFRAQIAQLDVNGQVVVFGGGQVKVLAAGHFGGCGVSSFGLLCGV